MEWENGNGQIVIHMYPRVKTSLSGHLLKTNFYKDHTALYKDHI